MKVLQTIASFGSHDGGISTCTYDLLSAMHHIGYSTDLLTLQSADLMGNGEAWIKALSNDVITPYGYSRNIQRFLAQSDYELYHTNGMWLYCNHATCRIARKKNRPYIITPHGMLYPQALARSAWKKKLMLTIGGVNKDLKLADCIHCTCMEEMKYYRDLGYKNPVAVIPNPVPVPSFIDELMNERKIKRIGFLGRLHPRKNVEALLDAWMLLGIKVKDAQLVIMGKGDFAYEKMLKEKVKESGMMNVEFAGFVNGREKFERLASLTALCVPSDFENFGMIVTEALSVGTPVIASLGTPWQELNTEHCGYWIDADVKTLSETIEQVLSLPENEIRRMGENGKRLVQERYQDAQVAQMIVQLYDWLITGGKKPMFIYE
ncbi:glycosyltransferase [Phocaeicola salanitronis]|uniref:glycosyltransferase n=1 Tax=Phocaeicola salanitronis TaxID=376805 RepID=UPI0025A39FC0|nr:glycosyltransferase [Phocaeicola salanitronis]MDM8306084.1 glycosyltransferase [Phocaeicola salanitronis]